MEEQQEGLSQEDSDPAVSSKAPGVCRAQGRAQGQPEAQRTPGMKAKAPWAGGPGKLRIAAPGGCSL